VLFVGRGGKEESTNDQRIIRASTENHEVAYIGPMSRCEGGADGGKAEW